MLVTLITPTGARAEAFALCELYMKRQTYKGQIQWLVIDDCKPETKCNLNQEYYRGPRDWQPGLNTQRFNMELALEKVKGDIIFPIEDDEYYAPNYIETMVEFLKHVSIAGISRARYYHVKIPGYKLLPNEKHAALSQTALRKDCLHLLKGAVNSGEFYFDGQLWHKARQIQKRSLLIANTNLSIGIKGLPGRTGLTPGHKEKDYLYDANHAMLSSWIGADKLYYMPFMKKGK